MAMVTSQPLSFDTKDRLRDASFSSYLNSSEKPIIRKLSESGVNPNSLYLGKKKSGEGEIGVFGAEKYFNGVVEEENPIVSNNIVSVRNQYPKNAPIDIGHVKPKIQPRTPSIHSESSWHSQSGLLQSGKRIVTRGNGRKRNGKNFLSNFRCRCACADVDENAGETNSKRSLSCGEIEGKTAKNGSDSVDLVRIKSGLNPRVMEEIHCKKIDDVGNGLNREDCFSFPILNSKVGGNPNPVNFQENEDEKQGNSLDVFGSPVLDKKKTKNSFSIERNPAVWELRETDSTAGGFEIPRSSDGLYNDDDNESDASSDLFEIESFTNSGNSILMRNGSDGNMSSCVTPTTCYAPSEASIEWSVVTASAAEFSSVISDSEELMNTEGFISSARKMQGGPNAAKASAAAAAGGKEMERRRSGMLLSCKSSKAVRVAGDAYVRSGKGNPDPRRRQRSGGDGEGK